MLFNQIMHIVTYIPSSLLTYYIMARMLDIGRRWRFAFGLTAIHALLAVLYMLASKYNPPMLDTAKVILQTSVYLLGALAFAKQPLSQRLLAFGLCYLSVLFGEVASVIAFSLLGGAVNAHGIADAANHLPIYLFMQTANFAALTAALAAAMALWDCIICKTHRRVLWHFVLFPISQTLAISIAAYYATLDNFHIERYLVIAVSIVVCVIADLLLFYAIDVSSKRAVAEERAAWYEQLLGQQQTYYIQLLADLEDASRIRHDIRNQLEVVRMLTSTGETVGAQRQLQEIRDNLDRAPHYCANRVVNALLGVKAARLAEEGIRLDCQCAVPSDLPVSGVDLCSLFSNVLDNALNACLLSSAQEKTISIRSGISGNVFTLRCSNPFDPKAEKNRPRQNGHGFGLDILRDLAGRYSGELQIDQADDCFTVTVWLTIQEALAHPPVHNA